VNLNDAICFTLIQSYPTACSSNSYLTNLPFNVYCAQLCNNCPTTKTTTTTTTSPAISTLCQNLDDAACVYFAQAFPSFCTSNLSYLYGQPFGQYCAKACGKCTTQIPTSSPSTSSSSSAPCKNQSNTVCASILLNNPYACSVNAYFINGYAFNVYCKLSCNNC